MKKRLGVILLFCMVMGMTACGMDKGPGSDSGQAVEKTDPEQNKPQADKQSESAKEEPEKKTDENQAEDKETQSPDAGDNTNAENGDLTQPQGEREVDIYSSNEDATELITAKVTIPDMTAQLLLTELAHKGVIPDTIKVTSCRKVKKDGKEAIDLDLSAEFETYLNTQGTTGELITMGSLCNTFLKAYNCESIHTTVESEVLSSGHAEYPGYLGYFESIR